MKLVGHAILVIGVAALLAAAVNLQQAWQIDELQGQVALLEYSAKLQRDSSRVMNNLAVSYGQNAWRESQRTKDTVDALTIIVSEEAAYAEMIHATAIEAAQTAVIANNRISAMPDSFNYERNLRTVVLVEKARARAAGVLVAPGVILTAAHVLTSLNGLRVTTYDGEELKITGTWAYGDPFELDLGIIFVEPSVNDNPVAHVRCEAFLDYGDPVAVVGHPVKTDWSVSWSRVSNPRRVAEFDDYVLDINVNPGNSGGPLFDVRGNVLGIVSAMEITPLIGDGVAPMNIGQQKSGHAYIVSLERICPILEALDGR